MELKHFGHNHGLALHQVPQGSQIQCAACKSPGSGNVYACWQCKYFLHDHCFRATRSLKHPSHLLHPLTLMPSPTYPSGSFICNSCILTGDGLSYSCSECEFDIHVHCALIPNPNHNSQVPKTPVYPQPNATTPMSEVRHKFHPHPLTLLAAPGPMYAADGYTCDACLKQGRTFVYHCPTCNYDLHADCFSFPETVSRPDHDHTLSLSAPISDTIMCDVCRNIVDEKAWWYRCGECDYGTHLECVNSQEKEKETGDITDQLLELRQQQMQNYLQYQRTRVNNQYIAQKIENSVISFGKRKEEDYYYYR